MSALLVYLAINCV